MRAAQRFPKPTIRAGRVYGKEARLERVAALRAKRAEEDKKRASARGLRRLEEFRRRQREEAEKEKQARAASTTPTPAETRPVSTTRRPCSKVMRGACQAQPSAQPQFSFTQNGAYLAGGHYQQSQQPQQQQHRESHTSFAPTPTLWSPPGQPHPYQPRLLTSTLHHSHIPQSNPSCPSPRPPQPQPPPSRPTCPRSRPNPQPHVPLPPSPGPTIDSRRRSSTLQLNTHLRLDRARARAHLATAIVSPVNGPHALQLCHFACRNRRRPKPCGICARQAWHVARVPGRVFHRDEP
ncbi:hypothetical protein BCR44DRAFT_1194690 [Catenaria anguillulae PL171]|uniref:Uncharacterized protein n=1 Tax=Catenaria anguillulae PL171 TaxID=765915 RepID=A0A1Y2HGA6_9FUNG|nr:hypothetical protein BCR44DRAFT_1194690 [Catenaria anguillulae PL171]